MSEQAPDAIILQGPPSSTTQVQGDSLRANNSRADCRPSERHLGNMRPSAATLWLNYAGCRNAPRLIHRVIALLHSTRLRTGREKICGVVDVSIRSSCRWSRGIS